MKKEKAVIFLLVVLLVLALGYIGYVRFQARDYNIYQSGTEYGYQGAVVQIFQKTSPPACEQLPIYVQNQTLNLISVECLQMAQQQAQTKGNGSK